MNKHGRVEVTKPANFTAKEDGNPSLIGYKLRSCLFPGIHFPVNYFPHFSMFGKYMES